MPRTISNPVVREQVFDGRTNTVVLLFTLYDPITDTDTPISWTGITRMVLNLYSARGATPVVVDTATAPAAIDRSVDGQITFKLGGLGIPVGSYRGRLTTVDALSNKSELFNEQDQHQVVVFDIVSTATVT